jgi:prophage regulatory protein
MATEPVDRIVREQECASLTALSRTRRYELEQRGLFPKRIKLSERATGWRLSEIRAWIDARRPAETRAAS